MPVRSLSSITHSQKTRFVTFREITPGPFHSERLRQEIRNVIHRTQTRVKNLFEDTIESWETQVDFDVKESTSGGIAYMEVSTDSPLYYLVDHGAEAHTIPMDPHFPTLVFREHYEPKTVPRELSSKPSVHGGNYKRPVELTHPGFEARDFDETVRDEVEQDFQDDCQDAVDKFARNSGHHLGNGIGRLR